MKKMKLAVMFGTLLSGSLASTGLAAQPSSDAASLATLKDAVLCYSAEVEVDDEPDEALGDQARAIMLETLRVLKLGAVQYDDAINCDLNLDFTFGLDVAGAPSLYNVELSLRSFTARVGATEIGSATIWSDGYWGGDKDVWDRATYTKRMTDTLGKSLAQFTTDYRSLGK
ncbi:hypothetical protein [Deinococcus sp.]|uniref:hypothetical protein n=1 Tax=Deinococcus sp. TaxID=47478 RepID=UPI0025DEBF76|nr:hypothetical protein [Deinococcus sp.]